MDDRRQALHALNRLTFGPRPGDVDRVMAMGVHKWFEQQLHPEKIDDTALQARLGPLRTLRMNPRELVTNFPPPRLGPPRQRRFGAGADREPGWRIVASNVGVLDRHG